MGGTRVMLIAGEPSGDLLAAELVRAFQQLPEVQAMPWPPEFFGGGGPRMAAAGVEVVIDLTAHSVFGLTDALAQYFKFKGFLRTLFDQAVRRQPDVIILVDFGGFNLRFAAAIKRYVRSHARTFTVWDPKIVYYVSPQVWASRPGRADQLARNVDLLLSIFPFERDWYAARVPQLRVEFVGHPLIDRYSSAECGMRSEELGGRGLSDALGEMTGQAALPHRPQEPTPAPLPGGERPTTPADEGPIQGGVGVGSASPIPSLAHRTSSSLAQPLVVLLPGSRRREIEAHLPALIRAVRIIKKTRSVRLRMILPSADLAELAARIADPMPEMEIQTDGLAGSLREANLAVASSGTVTLECAFFRVPTVVIYKTSLLTYQIAKRLITVKHIAMPNLLAGETVYPELIQKRVTPEAIASAALELLNNPSRVAVLKSKLTKAIAWLGAPGASRRAATALFRLAASKRSKLVP